MALRAFALFLVLAVVSLAASPHLHAQSHQNSETPIELTRTVPLEIGAIPLPDSYSSAEQAFDDLKSYQASGNLLVIMEITRRAQQGLAPEQARQFLELVKKQYQQQFDSPLFYFEQGYAQYVMRRNPTGFLLIRAADKQIDSSATALAVAMAQVDLQRSQVVSPHAFDEALQREQRAPTPGFTESFERILHRLSRIPVDNSSLSQRLPASEPKP